MPNIIVSLPEGVLDANSKKQLVAGINSVAAEVEQLLDDPKSRFLCWVIIDETATGNWTCGGRDVTTEFIPVLTEVRLPVGLLDEPARAQYVAGVQRAVTAALPHEKRRILISCVLNEIENGLWGMNGEIWHLKDFARHVKHLQHLVETSNVKAA
jgi:phenylpyruvate tautomerase PptA (4-oxalocrotonate tautomerase family)